MLTKLIGQFVLWWLVLSVSHYVFYILQMSLWFPWGGGGGQEGGTQEAAGRPSRVLGLLPKGSGWRLGGRGEGGGGEKRQIRERWGGVRESV